MRTRKNLIFVFFVTFFTGICVYYLIPQTKKVITVPSVPQVKSETSVPKNETKEVSIFETSEILEENKDWENFDESKFKIKLLEVGEGYHGDEVDAKSGEIWLGLFEEGDRYFLKNTNLQIKRVNDPIIDGDTGKTGKSVWIKNENLPVFLLKNADFLKQGKVSSSFGGNPNPEEMVENKDYESLNDGFRREFTYQGETATLAVKSGVNKKGEKIAALILSNGKVNQTLHSLEYIKDGNYLGTLYWVGDLDSDGKPDFYLSLYFHDNVVYRNLFISSKATKGKLVKKIAVFTTTGC